MSNLVRIWVHEDLKKTLSKLNQKINDKSIEETGYPIPRGMPLSSEIASNLLENILDRENFIIIEKIDGKCLFDAKIDIKLTKPMFFLIINPKEDINIKKLKDKNYLNINFFKKKGIKQNDIQFI